MPDLNLAELGEIGITEQLSVKAQCRFISGAEMGLPVFSDAQLKRVSGMLAEKAKDMTAEEMDQLILAEAI